MVDYPGTEWVEHHRAGQFEQIGFLLDQDSLVPALKPMSNQAMTTIKPLGLSTIQLPHAERTVTDIAKDFQPGFAILIGSIKSFAPVSSCGDMIPRTRECQS